MKDAQKKQLWDPMQNHTGLNDDTINDIMNRTLATEQKKELWESVIKNIETDGNEFEKPIRDFVFNAIVNAPVMPDLKPVDENLLINKQKRNMKKRIPLFEDYHPEDDTKIKGVINIKSETDMATFGVVYRGSVLNESSGTYGLSHLSEHLLCKSIDHLQDEFDMDGIQTNAYTSGTYIYFFITGLDEYVNKHKANFLKLISAGLKITKEEFENEKKIVLEEYGDCFNSQGGAHYSNLMRKLYDYYGPIGLRKDLENVTYEAMIAFGKKQYEKPSAILNISKNNPWTTHINIATQVTSDMKFVMGKNDMCDIEVGNTYKGKSSIINISNTISDDIGYVKFICDMLSSGLNSPFYQEIREKRGLVYGLYCYFSELSDNEGNIIIAAESSTKNVEEFQNTIAEILGSPEKYMTKERFEIVKKKLKIKFKKQMISAFDYPEKFIEPANTRVESIIDNVTYEKIMNVYEKYFNFGTFYKSIDSKEFESTELDKL